MATHEGRALRFITVVLPVASWALFALAVVWPAVALVGRCIVDGNSPDGGFTFSSRQLGLLWRSVWLSAVATALCLAISLPCAYVVGSVRRLSLRPMMAGMMMALLLCPPMVYAFGWERILPATFDARARCIGVWAFWAWPIPAMLIGAGWARSARGTHEAAILATSPRNAFLRVALPVLSPYIWLSALVVFVLFLNDYGVPHACAVLVYSTELLGWAAGSTNAIDTAWPSTISILVTGVALVAMFTAWRRCAADEDVATVASVQVAPSFGLTTIAIGCFGVSWLIPMTALVFKLGSPIVFVDAFRTYGWDLKWSLLLAAFSGLVLVGMGVGLLATPRLRTLVLIWALAYGALPGALIGESLVAAYNHSATWWVFDYWPILALSHVAHFGWIGLLTAAVVTCDATPTLVDQAKTDGATRASILGHLLIPMNWPALLCGAGVAAAMSIADVATSSLVRVPSFSPIALILIEKFHRFEDGMLISLSVWLVGATLPATILLMLALRRENGKTSKRRNTTGAPPILTF